MVNPVELNGNYKKKKKIFSRNLDCCDRTLPFHVHIIVYQPLIREVVARNSSLLLNYLTIVHSEYKF